MTVTEQVAFLPPSLVVTVIVADPADKAVILPLEVTLATDECRSPSCRRRSSGR